MMTNILDLMFLVNKHETIPDTIKLVELDKYFKWNELKQDYQLLGDPNEYLLHYLAGDFDIPTILNMEIEIMEY